MTDLRVYVMERRFIDTGDLLGHVGHTLAVGLDDPTSPWLWCDDCATEIPAAPHSRLPEATRYNHLMGIAYEAVCGDPAGPSVGEALEALRRRLQVIEAMPPEEQERVLLESGVLDTYRMPDGAPRPNGG